MKYYIKFRFTKNFIEVTQKRYFSFKRNIDASETIIRDDNGRKIARQINLNSYNI